MKNANLSLRESKISEDYIFRHKLDLDCNNTLVFHNRLAELMRVILENLLGIIMPTKNGEDVKIDGFRWLMDRKEIYPLFSQTTSSLYSSEHSQIVQDLSTKTGEQKLDYQSSACTAFYEPRIDLIKKLTEALLNTIEFEYRGKTVKVDGFRLKNLYDWLVTSSGDPNEIIDQSATGCDCNCIFCCNKGTPTSIAVCSTPNKNAEEKFHEIKTRIKYFSPEMKRALFPTSGCVYEPMSNPHFLDILQLLRDKTSRPFRITTNGCNLNYSIVAELARLRPVYLYLSLNSSSPSRRMKLMKDPNPEVAINALPILRQHGIPYATVIVPWPLETIDEMLNDLASTVAYAAEHEAHLVQVNLPGYTRYFSPTELFDLHQVWKAIIFRVRELREKHDCPIVVMPTLYEENVYQQRKNMPQVIGVVKNSPAYLTGLQKGDIIKQINGIPVSNRPQARDLLALVTQSRAKEIKLNVNRDDQTLELTLNLTEHSYPYSVDIDAYCGIVFMGSGLRTSYIENLKDIIQTHRAKHVLFLSSELVKPVFEQCLTESHLLGDGELKIDIEVPKNNFFGGNIFMGDLLVVQDFIDHIKDYIRRNQDKLDLVVIPSSPFHLSGWGRDLTGRVYLDIERTTGIPVELLPCVTIYG